MLPVSTTPSPLLRSAYPCSFPGSFRWASRSTSFRLSVLQLIFSHYPVGSPVDCSTWLLTKKRPLPKSRTHFNHDTRIDYPGTCWTYSDYPATHTLSLWWYDPEYRQVGDDAWHHFVARGLSSSPKETWGSCNGSSKWSIVSHLCSYEGTKKPPTNFVIKSVEGDKR